MSLEKEIEILDILSFCKKAYFQSRFFVDSLPRLDWEKPELPKMLMGRLKSLLEGSCEAWCKAAACKQEEPQAPQRVHGCFDRFRCLVLVGGHKALQHPW